MSNIINVLLRFANPAALVALFANNAPGSDQVITQVTTLTDWQLLLSIAVVALVKAVKEFRDSRKPQ